MDGHAADRLGGVDQHHLHPHAGVVQLGLVTGGDQRLALGVAEPPPHVLPQSGGGHALHAGRLHSQRRGVGRGLRQQLVRRWPDEHLAVAGRGLPVRVSVGGRHAGVQQQQ